MDLLPGRGRHQHASGAAFDGDRVLLEDLDATAGERGPHHLAELGFGGWCEPADQAHLTAEVGEDLGLLHATYPPPTTTTDCGSPVSSIAVVDVRCSTVSIPGRFGTAGRAPVATR